MIIEGCLYNIHIAASPSTPSTYTHTTRPTGPCARHHRPHMGGPRSPMPTGISTNPDRCFLFRVDSASLEWAGQVAA